MELGGAEVKNFEKQLYQLEQDIVCMSNSASGKIALIITSVLLSGRRIQARHERCSKSNNSKVY
jgi:hypothetical protein